MLPALGKAAGRIRRELGESIASIERYDTPIEDATTTSLEALKAYSLGVQQRTLHGDGASLAAFERAAELDPDFALVHARLGAIYGNMQETDKSNAHLEAAYRLRDSVSEPERFYIDSHYYGSVTGDWQRMVENYELWKQTYPRDWTAPHNLGLQQMIYGDYEAALPNLRRALEIEPNHPFTHHKVAMYYLIHDRLDETKAVGRQALEAGLDAAYLRGILIWAALREGDEASLEEHQDAYRGTWAEAIHLELRANFAAGRGELREAQELTREAIAVRERFGQEEAAAQTLADLSAREALLGETESAVEHAGSCAGDE